MADRVTKITGKQIKDLTIELSDLSLVLQTAIGQAHDQNTDIILVGVGGTDILDRAQLFTDGLFTINYNNDCITAAQTFKPSRSADITKIAVCGGFRPAEVPTSVKLSLKLVDGEGKPTGSDLVSKTLLGANIKNGTLDDGWTEWIFDSPYALDSGTIYAIVLEIAGITYGYGINLGGARSEWAYANFWMWSLTGEPPAWELVGAQTDIMSFKTYMNFDNVELINNSELVSDLSVSAGTSIGGNTIENITDAVTKRHQSIVNEIPTGTIGSDNTDFDLLNTPITGTVQVYLNGILQEPGTGKDYILSGTTISFVQAPEVGDILLVSYDKV